MNNSVITKNPNSEFLYNGIESDLKQKHKADTPMDKSFVPYLIMAFCAATDLTCFLSLFSNISYDNKPMLCAQIAGLLFAFDIVPVYLGIYHKRFRQKLTRDRFPLYIALTVCAAALILNTALNIMTIDLMNPDAASTTDFFGNVQAQTASEELNPVAVAMTIFRIICPVLTSFGSYYVSYVTYTPVKTRIFRTEKALRIKKDEIRRMEAALDEYRADPEYAEHLYSDDEDKFESMKMMYIAKVNSYGKYIEQRLKEHLADPKSTSALSEKGCRAFIESFEREKEAFLKASALKKDEVLSDNSEETNFIAKYEAV